MNQDREDVSMVEGELPVQPTNPSMPNHLLPEAGAAAQGNNPTQAVEITKVSDTDGQK